VPLLPWVAIYCIVRYGPFPNRWWRGENFVGFAFLIGTIGFSLGFFGPMILSPRSNQGPLLGILITGPWAMLLGIVWGLLRAWKRRLATTGDTAGR
jgi:hypothetical protein